VFSVSAHTEEAAKRISAELKKLLTIQETLLAKYKHWLSDVTGLTNHLKYSCLRV
jgi:hypothetical protein